MIFRKATLGDLHAITSIYNDAILLTVATFDTEPKTIDEMKTWYASHNENHPILVAEQNGVVVGWASLSEWSDRCAYSETAEISVYVKKEHQGIGIGRKLLRQIMQEGLKTGLHTVVARIAESNEQSLNLFRSEQFADIGVMREVGRKFGKRLNVYLMQKIYDN